MGLFLGGVLLLAFGFGMLYGFGTRVDATGALGFAFRVLGLVCCVLSFCAWVLWIVGLVCKSAVDKLFCWVAVYCGGRGFVACVFWVLCRFAIA